MNDDADDDDDDDDETLWFQNDNVITITGSATNHIIIQGKDDGRSDNC